MSLSPSQSSSESAAPLDTGFEHVASASSTPPTNFSDNISVASDGIKVETTPAPEPAENTQEQQQQQPVSGRARRARASNPTYNLTQLSGTSSHGKRRANGDEISERSEHRRRTISGTTLVNHEKTPDRSQSANGNTDSLIRGGIDALDLQWTMDRLKTPSKNKKQQQQKEKPGKWKTTRASTRLTSSHPEPSLVAKATTLGKRGRNAFEESMSKMSRELRRLQDTKEYAHIDEKPVLHTIWANGKEVTLEELEANNEPARKKSKTEEKKADSEEKKPKAEEGLEVQERKGRRTKRWLDKGLFAGQPTPTELPQGLSTTAEKRRLAQIPELATSGPFNKALPLPMFNGLRTLMNGRDFKLPFDVCNPLPPGQPKPEHWTKISKNRFVGDASLYWKKSPHLSVDGSKCICKREDGCGEDCQNRIMLYECDDKNCNVGKDKCTNRSFADLQERKTSGGKYRTGVEVIKTPDRGYGVRVNRCFEAGQIIMEYTGEIITEEECENRMNTKYKNNDCYYLMSFDQNMIIDATTGSIARFVNHSCKPNCRMIKWIVSGQPRMALFAGDEPLTTGDELTYDYNFDPFSSKNVQTCLCGEENCRGVLGPKPKDQKHPKAAKSNPKAKTKENTKTKAKTLTKAKATKPAAKTATKSPIKTTKPASKVAAKPAAKSTAKETIQAATKRSQTAKAVFNSSVKDVVKAGKRKLEDLVGDEEDAGGNSAKKRKTKAPTGAVKRSLSNASTKVAKVAAKGAATVKKSVSTVTVNAKAAPAGKKTPSSKMTMRMSSHGRIIKSSKKSESFQQTTTHSTSRASSMTIVAAGAGGGSDENGTPGSTIKAAGPETPGNPQAESSKSVGSPSKGRSSAAKSPRRALELPRVDSRIRMVSPEATITARVAA